MVENPFKNPLVITILTVWEIKTEKLFTYVCNMHAYDMHIHVLGVHISAGVCVCVHLWVLGINDDCLPRFLYTLYVEVRSLGEPFWLAWLASLVQGIQAGCQVYAAVT